MSRRLLALDLGGAALAAVAGVILAVSLPASDEAPARAEPMAWSAARASRPPSGPAQVELALPEPAWLPLSTLRRAGLRIEARLPEHGSPDQFVAEVGGQVLPFAEDQGAARLPLPATALAWGLNLIHVTGADTFGRPVDEAFALMVGNRREPDDWVERALLVRLTPAGFDDEDARPDDLSSIVEAEVEAALRRLGAVEAGPVTARNFRVGDVGVDLRPRPGALEARLDLRLLHVDVDVDLVVDIRIDDLPINRMWLDVVLAIEADREGRPVVRVESVEPHVDLVRTRGGVGNWILDHGAWFLEITAELLSEEPIREALVGTIDEALSRWVSSFRFSGVAPLRPVELLAEYRFGEISLDENGLGATVDFRLTCPGGSPDPRRADLGALRGATAPRYTLPDVADHSADPIEMSLAVDAVNAVLHALWACGALDVQADFSEVAREAPALLPSLVETRFGLPPVVAPIDPERVEIAVGGAEASVHYPDQTYQVAASGRIPVVFGLSSDGRRLGVGFDPDPERVVFFTDCRGSDLAPCLDNPLFDRLAWMAVPFLPPIGATLPLPDVRLDGGEAERLRFTLSELRWDVPGGALQIVGRYQVD